MNADADGISNALASVVGTDLSEPSEERQAGASGAEVSAVSPTCVF